MSFSITNIGKAEDILVNAGFIDRGRALTKNNIKEAATKLNDDDIKKIVRIDKDNKLMRLEKAGRLLKDSWLTRFTGHKIHDFKSTWTASSTSFTQLCAKLRSAVREAKKKKREGSEQLTDTQKDEIKKRVAPALQKAQRQFSKLYKDCMSFDETKKAIEEFVKAPPNEQKAQAESALKALSDSEDIALSYVDFNQDSAREAWDKSRLSGLLGWLYCRAVIPTGLIAVGVGVMALAIGEAGSGVAAAVLLGPGAFLLIASTIAVMAVLYKADSIGFIKLKRRWARIQNEYKKAIRYLNEFEDKLEDEIGKALRNQSETEDFKVTNDMKNILETFLKNQKKIWSYYASSQSRGYLNEDGTVQPEDVTEHITGFRKTSNEKTHKIGKLKELLANIWLKLEIN